MPGGASSVPRPSGALARTAGAAPSWLFFLKKPWSAFRTSSPASRRATDGPARSHTGVSSSSPSRPRP
eukprot:12658478-Alexandrium_andersonii.AAC.1